MGENVAFLLVAGLAVAACGDNDAEPSVVRTEQVSLGAVTVDVTTYEGDIVCTSSDESGESCLEPEVRTDPNAGIPAAQLDPVEGGALLQMVSQPGTRVRGLPPGTQHVRVGSEGSLLHLAIVQGDVFCARYRRRSGTRGSVAVHLSATVDAETAATAEVDTTCD